MQNKKCAYATVLSTDSYLPGTLALFESIKRTKPMINNFVVVVNENIKKETRDRLQEEGYIVIEKPKIEVPQEIKNKNRILPYWNNTFDKFNLFDLTDFDKIVYLDSDIYVRKNIDELFDKPNMSAVIAGKSYPGNESWNELNSGLMVIEPQKGLREALINKMNSMVKRKRILKNSVSHTKGSFFSKVNLLKSLIVKRFQGVGDQDVLEEFFNWKDKPELHLDEGYNVFANYSDYYASKFGNDNLACIHFIGRNKPWNCLDKRRTEKASNKFQSQCFDEYIQIISNQAENFKAKFSLIIPMKNAEKYINTALESIREQEYKDVEICIIDDNSSDSSKTLVQHYANSHPDLNIKILETQEGHRGPGGARNIGLNNATGSYIVFLDSDDKMNQNALNSISKSIALNPETDIFTLGYQLTRLDQNDEPVSNLKLNAGKMQESRFFQIGANTAGSIWNLCIRKSLFDKDKKVRFKENCKFEDLPTKVGLFTRTKRKIKSVPHITHTQFSRPGSSITGTLTLSDMRRLIDANLEIANLRPDVDLRDKMYINVRMVMMPVVLGWLVQKCIHNKIDLARMNRQEQYEPEI